MTKNTNVRKVFLRSDADYHKSIENLLNRKSESGELTQDDVGLIRTYVRDVRASSLISAARQLKLVQNLCYVRSFVPSFRECTLEDLKCAKLDLYDAVDESGNPRYSLNTQNDWLKGLKRFVLWMSRKGYSSINAFELKEDFKVTSAKKITKSPDDMLTEEEVLGLIRACKNSRDRCLFSMLYEGALRIGELGGLKWGDLRFLDNLVTMETDFKTGKRRHIPFITSRSYIIQWKNDYPLPITDNSPVFISFQSKELLTYRTIYKHTKELANAAGIAKHVTPHIFRHSRITHMIQKNVPESAVKMLGWGSLSTDMLDTYCHLSDGDLDKAVFEMNGISYEVKDFSTNAMEPVCCTNCGHVNAPGIKFCGLCGTPLDENARQSMDIVLDKLRKLMSTNPVYAMNVLQGLEKQ